MIDDAMKSDRIIGMIQPRKTGNKDKPDLYKTGCAGKYSFNETEDGRYLIIINGISRFNIINEVDAKDFTGNVKLITIIIVRI